MDFRGGVGRMKFCLLGCWWVLAAVRVLAASFQAGLDRNSVELGGSVVLFYSFSDYGNVEAPQPPAVAGADIQYLGASTQSSLSIINGRRSQQTTLMHRYAVVPKQVGVLTIPQRVLRVPGGQVVVPAMQLQVTKGMEVTDVARLEFVAPTNVIYVGQPFVAQVQLWFRQQPAQVGNPELSTDGFLSGRSVRATAGTRRVGNEVWGVTEWPVILSPARAGMLPLGPAKLETLFTIGPRRGGFFGDMFAEQRRFTFSSGSNRVEAVAPPVEGQPEGFNGVIGKFTVGVSARPTTVTVGDPITVRVVVEGRGSLETLGLAELPPNSGFRTYAGTNGVQWSDPKDPFNFRGTKVFELAVVPERADLTLLKLPPLVSFDPETRRYVEAEVPGVAIQVSAGADAQAMPSLTPAYAANVETNLGPITAAQLQPLGSGVGRVAREAPPWTNRLWYWLALGMPAVGSGVWSIVAAWWCRRRQDPAAVRRAAAESRAQAAWQRLENAQGAELYEALDQALRERVALATGMAPGAVDHGTIERALVPQGFSEEEASRFRWLLEVIETGRFSPGATATDTSRLRREAEQFLSALRQWEGSQ